MKINWFSPLPPANTEIANYTKTLLPYLQEKVEVTLWTNQQKWDEELEKYTSVKQYKLEQMPWFELNQGDVNIYNLGNNASFHGEIWQVAQLFPGIVILHDQKLQDFFYMFYPDKNDYIQQMKKTYGQEGGESARLFLNEYHSMEFMTENYPLTSLALENALGVITHNREVYLSLSQENQWLIGYTPLPYINDRCESNLDQKQQQKPYKLIMFGFIGKNRRLETVLQALSQFKQKDSFRLNIYGQLWDENYIREQIQILDLENLVTIHGFVSDEELDFALSNSDLGINLRYPTMGEASGSQMRLWNHSLPSLVTKIGWYSNLNSSAVAFVRHDREIEDIHKHLQGFLDNPSHYQQMGRKGKKILETDHRPELYAEAIVNFVTEISKYRSHSSIDRIVKRVAIELNYLNSDIKSPEYLSYISETIKFITAK
ncbi:glycosyltransferase [Geminocystis sp. NIES-3709]|uniref:glycosyltransferase n=1 Tax=Geminocystis sp. NIES-3709 TaxID=1617448 RepID=UPI0005FC9C76|nr:glycosyltransferase [Geminocystis sp. NIES-3709]BAQ63738.1 glycosyl transferase group 1 [Geminocystis sp. NIES-3709]